MPDFVKASTRDKVKRYVADNNKATPYLLVDREVLCEKIALIGRNIRNSKVFYAIKANPDRQIAEILNNLGVGFEISSDGELHILSSLGVGPERIITSNPVKTLSFLEEAAKYGIRHFAYDSKAEVGKMSQYVPGSQVYVRLSVPNEGSEWPLSKKFGVEIDQARELLFHARDKGLDPAGITFHVGSQCTDVYSWNIALDKVRELWDDVEAGGIKLKVLNIGGGYPVRYTKSVVDIETIEKRIDSIISGKFPEDIDIYIEPGRAVVGDAGIFVTTVIGKAPRIDDENWLYVDVGVFNGLMESVGGIKYTYIVDSEKRNKHWVLAGPSCDSFDVIERDVELPEPEIGSKILILSSGAYTTSYASEFNGFPIPKIIIL